MKSIENTAVGFYLAAIFLAVPLYYSDGYYRIGDDKFSAFFWSTLVFFILMLFALFTRKRERGRMSLFAGGSEIMVKRLLQRFSPVDIAAAFYGLFVIFSYLCSPYRKDLVFGEPGWHMGLVMRLFSLTLYFLLSRHFDEQGREGIKLILLSSALVFLYGFLGRFGVRPLEMGGSSEQFIGTIGNVDWFAGLWTMLFPIGLYAFLQEKKASGLRALSAYICIGIAFSLICGAQSSVLLLLFYLFLAFLASFGSNNRFRRFVRLLCCFAVTVWLVRLLRLFIRMDMERDPLIDFFTDPANLIGDLFWFGFAAAVFFLRSMCPRLFRRIRISACKPIRNAILAILVFLFFLYLLLILIRGSMPGFLPFLNGSPYFALNDSFGSGRGRIWRGSLQMFAELHPLEKLLGVGPDGYASFLYGSFSGVTELTAPFGGARLTNGHSVMLTELVNIGILGTAAFLSLIVICLKRQLRLFKLDPEQAVFLFPVCGYLLFGLINFDMVLNYPYLFVFIAAGEAMIRGRESLDGEE